MNEPTADTILVIAHEWDSVARSVVEILRANAFDVVTATPSALCSGAVTYLSVGGSTEWASTVPTTAGGERTISSSELGAVLNRAVHLDPTGFADEDDESYAACERAALFTAMVEALDSHVLNRSRGTTLSGPPHLEAEWMATAVRCGIGVRAMSWTSDGIELEAMRGDAGSVTVIGDQVVPGSHSGAATEWASMFGDRATRLASVLGCELLRLELGECIDGRCVVTGIDPRPAVLEPHVVLRLAHRVAAGRTPTLRTASRSDLEYAS